MSRTDRHRGTLHPAVTRRGFLRLVAAGAGAGLWAARRTEAAAGWSLAEAARPYRGMTIKAASVTHWANNAVQPLIPEFERETGIKVDFEYLERTALNAKLDVELGAKTGAYDIVHIDVSKVVRYQQAGWTVPLDAFLQDPGLADPKAPVADFVPPFLKTVTVDGKIYGLPFSGESTAFFYRTDLYEKKGVKPPRTMEELDAVNKIVHSGDVPAFAMRAVKGEGLNVFTWTTWLRSYGGQFFDAQGRPILDSPQAVKATEEYARLLQTYGPKGVASYRHFEILADFQQEKLVSWIDATSLAARINDPKTSRVTERWAMAPVPRGPAGQFPGIYAHAHAIAADSKKKEAAWLFVQWCTSPDVQLRRAAKEGGAGDVTRVSVLEAPEFKKWWSKGNYAEVTLASAKVALPDYRPTFMPEWLEVGDRLGTAIQQVITKERDAKSALTAANVEIARILKK
jgi:multiple sugar transport system substrate-binding protein